MNNKQKGIFEMIMAILMMAVLVKMLVVTRAPKSYVCQPQTMNGYIVCDYQY